LKKHALLTLLIISLLVAGARPGYAISKEMYQMMQELDALQQAVQTLQKTVDTQTAVLKTLIEQANDSVNKMKVNMDDLHDSMQKNLATSNAHLDSIAYRQARRAINADSEHHPDFERPQPTSGCTARRCCSRARRGIETPGKCSRSR
jgi:ElaB/YqjD/DUF883 family membrane-anchored ribosome-binding protein